MKNIFNPFIISKYFKKDSFKRAFNSTISTLYLLNLEISK